MRLATAALVVVLGLLFLGSAGLWEKDEARYSQAAREMSRSGDLLVPTLGGKIRLNKPPFFYWTLIASQRLFGETEWAVRLPSAFAMMLIALIVFLVGRRVAGETAGLVGAIVWATSAYSLGMSRLCHPDAPLALFVTAATACLFFAWKEGFQRKRIVLLAWAFMGLGFLTKGPHGVILPILVTGIFLAIRREWSGFRKLLFGRGLAIAILPVALWGGAVILRLGWDRAIEWYQESVGRFVGGKAFHPEPVWFFVPVIIAGFVPWTLRLPEILPWFGRRRDPAPDRTFLLTWFAVVFLFFSLSPNKASGYVLPALPPLAVAAGVVMARTRSGVALRLSGALHLLLVLGVAITGAIVDLPPQIAEHEGVVKTAIGTVLLLIAIAGAMALAGRSGAATLASATTGIAFLILAVGIIAPIENGRRSMREPGLAVHRAIEVEDLFVNLESSRAGLIWYADHPVETRWKLPEVVERFDGPRRMFVFMDADRMRRFTRKLGRAPEVFWERPGRHWLVIVNRR